MDDFIEEVGDFPSLIEIRNFVVETTRRTLADEHEADEQLLQTLCNNICRAMFFLSAGDRGALHVLTTMCTPAGFADMENDLAVISNVFAEPISAICAEMEAWTSDFWACEDACEVHWHAFSRELDRMVLSVLTTQDRQRILAAYGESA